MPKMTFGAALNEALRLEMERDPNVYVVGEDVGAFGGCFGVTTGLLAKFGEKRVRDTRSPRAPSWVRRWGRRRPGCGRWPS